MKFNPENLDKLLRANFKPSGPGGVLALLGTSGTLYQGALGQASLENPLTLTVDSVFNTGSLAKQFTAFAIFTLQQQRKLKIDDEVRRYIPELPNYGRPLRIRHLLWHSSGLRCYTTLLWWAGVPQRDNFSRRQSIEMVCRQKELNFKPGDEYLYGNSNYLLLSEIVERVSGKSMADFCRKAVFEPLGMSGTHFRDKPGLPIPGLASGHMNWGGSLIVNRNLGAVPGVGRLMSRVGDLAKWDRFFSHPAKAMLGVQRSMLTQGWLDNGQKIRYGGGLMFQRYRGLNMVRHDGYASGCRAEFCRFPDKGVTVICLTNTTAVSPTWVARQVADQLWGRELEPVSALGPGQPAAPPARAKIATSRLKGLTGLYRAQNQGALAELALHEKGLRLSSMHNEIDFVPESSAAFQGHGAGKIYRLDLEEGGTFILTKQGRAQRYEPLRARARASEGKWDAFIGRYACPEVLGRLDVVATDEGLKFVDSTGIDWPLRHIKGGHFFNYFRDIRFSKRGMVMEGVDHWVRRLKWVRL